MTTSPDAARGARDTVVLGASAGGVPALLELLGALPADLPAEVYVVLHRSPHFESRLAEVLGRRSRLPVFEPAEGEAPRRGWVHLAPRDLHVEVRDGSLAVHRGAREHFTRPAIDPLFRSAAASRGPRVVGVLLSGMGADGVAGLMAISERGGLALVQDPAEAQFSALPERALLEDHVYARLRVAELAVELGRLCGAEPSAAAEPAPGPAAEAAPVNAPRRPR